MALKLRTAGTKILTALEFLRREVHTDAFDHATLEVKSDGGFFGFDDEPRLNLPEKRGRNLGAANPHPNVADSGRFLGTVKGVKRAAGDRSSVLLLEPFDQGSAAHRDFNTKHMTVALTSLRLDDRDASIRVKDSGSVSVETFHGHSCSAVGGMMAKSGETENRQSRAKQVERPGVCNEHVPSAKAKMCSELRGNTERAAEMTVPDMVGYYSTPKPSSSNKIGDRQCPTGRMYMGNTRSVYFEIDPSVQFKWSEKRTWPDQLLDIRILSLRTTLVFRSRMFLGVLDGWTL